MRGFRVFTALVVLAGPAFGQVKTKALIAAARSGDVVEVEKQLDAGANINLEIDNVTALSAAIDAEKLDVVKLLLSRGAALYQANWHGEHPIMTATRRFQANALALVLQQYLPPDVRTKELSEARKWAKHVANQPAIGLLKRSDSVQQMDDWIKDVNESQRLIRAHCDSSGSEWQPNPKDMTFSQVTSGLIFDQVKKLGTEKLVALGLPSESKDQLDISVWNLSLLKQPAQAYFLDLGCKAPASCNYSGIFKSDGSEFKEFCDQKYFGQAEFESPHCKPDALVSVNGKPEVITSEGNSFEWFVRGYLVKPNEWEPLGLACGGGD
jgi:hypothetical protein